MLLFYADSSFQQPYSNITEYPVIRNVRDYGAQGDGKTDDWKAFDEAMKDGERCGADCKGTSTRGTVLFVPSGNYLISKPIMQYYFTILVGDPKNRPTIIGTENFEGIALIDSNFYIDGGSG